MKHLKENRILKEEALTALKGKWGLAILTFVIFMSISMLSSRALFVFGFLISAPLAVGFRMFYLSLSRGETPHIVSLFKYFNNRFGTYLWAYVVMIIRVILWSLLLIVPGIIAAISYSQTFFVLAEDDSVSALEAIDKSKHMMSGHKWKYFKLILSFIGWAILCIFTIGIGFLWLCVYMSVTKAKFYDELKVIH